MYKSPIDTLISDIVTEEENVVMRAVVKCGINVDKDELVKALAYDRGQYEKGYADAKAELIRCGDCKNYSGEGMYCAWNMIARSDGYCFHANEDPEYADD